MELKLEKIKVEPQDIASCDPKEPFECAIACALDRYGYVDAIVNFRFIEIHENETEYFCSQAITDWQLDLMEGDPVYPITLVFDEENEKVWLEKEYQQQ